MSNPGVCDDDLYKELDMDEVDMNIEDYEELFGLTLNNSEELFQNGGLDSLFGTKDVSAADSKCQGDLLAEVYCSSLITHVPFLNVDGKPTL
ncbi:hypothetical protein EUGRSUZ_B02332 [Eucalyptus grandis]|uniref:Uncharacterized protein n=2 Tax=Eucalyptus grandis TaxID=71139 RepID=A0ACC3LT53_EUCGR|nr:hypothetical protein EUGRSUZ_B02332 [Eucalyptus grandis]